MKAVNVSELSGAALDWAMAQVVGVAVYNCNQAHMKPWLAVTGGGSSEGPESWRPSTDWSQGGPIITDRVDTLSRRDSMNIKGLPEPVDEWIAISHFTAYDGPTPLTAACRAIVSAKLGDTVEVPEELL